MYQDEVYPCTGEYFTDAKIQVFGSVKHSIILNPLKSRVFQIHVRNYLLLLLEMLVLDTSLIAFDTVNSRHTLFRSQEPGVRRRIREEEP